MQNHYQMFAGLAAAVAVVLLVLGHHQALAHSLAEETRPLIETTVNDSKYTVPVFEDVQMSDARKKLDIKAIDDLVGLLEKLIKAVIVEKRNILSVGRITLGIIPVAKRTSASLKELAKTDTSPKLADGYGKKMSELIFGILENKSTLELTDEEAAKRAFGLLQAVKELCAKSPTGLYLDWRALRVDGELLEEHAGHLVYWAKRNNYRMVLKGFTGLAAFVRSFSN